MHVLLCSIEDHPHLRSELRRAIPVLRVESELPGLFVVHGTPGGGENLPPLVFPLQMLPSAVLHSEVSIRGWSELLIDEALRHEAGSGTWRLHVISHYGREPAGQHRCKLITASVTQTLRRSHRRLSKSFEDSTGRFTPTGTLIQLLLVAPDRGYLSVACAPLPSQWPHLISPWPKGEIPVVQDKSAPSRAFAKLIEAERRLGHRIGPGETCTDLGASPGSWSYVALGRGAEVTAVDRAPLRADLMRHRRLRFVRGDAFRYRPMVPVDWLLCDVIAAPERSIALLLDWAQLRLCRRFVVSIKFKGVAGYSILDPLKEILPKHCHEFFLKRLCANKNEACAAGVLHP